MTKFGIEKVKHFILNVLFVPITEIEVSELEKIVLKNQEPKEPPKTEVSEDLTPIDCLAQLLNVQNAKKQGYSHGARWLCMDEERREHWRNEARKVVKSFSDEERGAEERRNRKHNEILNP